jgi:hypothetical protein
MQKILNSKLSLFIVTILLWSNATFAQDPGGPIDNDPGVPVTPIDSWIPFMLLLGLAMVFFYTYKKKSITN